MKWRTKSQEVEAYQWSGVFASLTADGEGHKGFGVLRWCPVGPRVFVVATLYATERGWEVVFSDGQRLLPGWWMVWERDEWVARSDERFRDEHEEVV